MSARKKKKKEIYIFTNRVEQDFDDVIFFILKINLFGNIEEFTPRGERLLFMNNL